MWHTRQALGFSGRISDGPSPLPPLARIHSLVNRVYPPLRNPNLLLPQFQRRNPTPSPPALGAMSPRRPKRPRSRSPPIQKPKFPCYLDSSPSSLPPTVRLLCSLLSSTPPSSLPSLLSSLSPPPLLSTHDLELILSLSYSSPLSTLSFFHWSLSYLNPSPSPYSWNLLIDLLGKNRLFSPMHSTLLRMHSLSPSLLSLATFASLFSSFALARLPDLALHTFDTMHSQFTVPRNTPALNSLLSAFCRYDQTLTARDLLRKRQHEVPPDSDTYAILLEGWENARDPRHARDTFDEMLLALGWDPGNVAAYDSFLCTLLRSSITDTMRYLSKMKEKKCYPGMKFFRAAVDEMEKRDDAKGASLVWETVVGRNGCYPDTEMCNVMIGLQCYGKRMEEAMRCFDDMVVFGAFPDGKTYNVLLKYLLREGSVRDAAAVFGEMVKNGFVPSEANCEAGVRVFLDGKDWEMGVRVLRCMVENGYKAEESGNAVVGRLKDFDRLPEACKLAEDMIDKRVKLSSATLTKLRTGLLKIGRGSLYDQILTKWKLRT